MQVLGDISGVVDEQLKPHAKKIAQVSTDHRALARKVDKALYGLAGIRLLVAVLVFVVPLAWAAMIAYVPWAVERSVESVLLKHGVLGRIK